MKRLAVALLALAFLPAPLAAEAQPVGKPARVGWLHTAAPGSLDDAFRQRLRELGYVERQNVTIEWRWAEGKS